MIKKIDNLGRVVIPKGYRMMLGLKPGDPLNVEAVGDSITISPYRDSCTFCGGSSTLVNFMEKYICPDCLSRIRAIPGA